MIYLLKIPRYGLSSLIFMLFLLFAKAGLGQSSGADFNQPLILGNKESTVKIIEYVSLTCGHCADFHRLVFPKIKEKYIDTGLISFEIRDFPLDAVALRAAVLARCAVKPALRAGLFAVMLETQDEWISNPDPVGALNRIAADAGLSEQKIQTCNDNVDLHKIVGSQRQRGSSQYGVSGTPTLVLNDKIVDGGARFNNLSRAIEKALP